jgi:hypothetical protein
MTHQQPTLLARQSCALLTNEWSAMFVQAVLLERRIPLEMTHLVATPNASQQSALRTHEW